MKKLILLLSILFAVPALASVTQITTLKETSIPVYNEPNTNAKPIMTLTKGQKVISIYEQNDWLKVANPDNGNVGWIKKSDWKAAASNIISVEQIGNGYSISSQNADGSVNSTYRVLQSNVDKVSSEEMTTFFGDLQKQQQSMGQRFEQLRQEMLKNVETLDAKMKKLWQEKAVEDPKDQNQKDKK